MRSADPAAAARAFVAAGRVRGRSGEPRGHGATVKVCGITDAEGILAAVRAGADAIGLNLVPGTPRELSLDGGDRRSPASPRSLAGAAAARRRDHRRRRARADRRDRRAPSIPMRSSSPATRSSDDVAAAGRPVWKALRVRGEIATTPAAVVDRGLASFLAAGARADPARRGRRTAPGRHRDAGRHDRSPPPSPARCRSSSPAASTRPTSPAPLRDVPAVGVDSASGTERPRVAGERPRKDPLRVALFVKRARAARVDRPNIAAAPDGRRPRPPPRRRARPLGDRPPVRRPLRARDAHGGARAARGGLRRDPPGPRVLVGAARAPRPLRRPPDAALPRGHASPTRPSNGPSPLDPIARLPRRLRLHLKREDLAHTGAHKINNALGQALLTRRLGKDRVIAETGAGQHGVATATACALLDLPCVVFMGAVDIERQQPNVLRMQALGAEVRPVTSGTATLKDAVNDAMRDWVTNVETTHYVLGSAMGPHPYPTIVRDLQRRIGDEAAAQVVEAEGRLPDLVLACVGGGSNAIGLLDRFIGEPSVRLAVAEAAGDGIETGTPCRGARRAGRRGSSTAAAR